MTNTSIARNFLLTVTLLAAWSCDLRPSPPFSEPERLVVIREMGADGASLGVSHGNYLTWRDSSPGLESASAHDVTDQELQGHGPQKVSTVRCTVDFLETLGVAPVLGRAFVAGDREHSVAVLSYELWQDRFAGKPDIIGGVITLDGKEHTVVGILPEGSRYPDTADVWALLPRPAAQDGHDLTVTARLSPGVTPEQAELSLNEVDLPCGHGAGVTAFRDVLADESR